MVETVMNETVVDDHMWMQAFDDHMWMFAHDDHSWLFIDFQGEDVNGGRALQSRYTARKHREAA